MTHRELGKIDMELDDLLLPYKIDLSLFRQIDNPNLIDHIERVGGGFLSRRQGVLALHIPMANFSAGQLSIRYRAKFVMTGQTGRPSVCVSRP